MSNALVAPLPAMSAFASGTACLPSLVTAAGDQASLRFLEFFAGTIRNAHTRRAYARALGAFLTWCEETGVPSIAAVQPLHVATWIEMQTRDRAAPSVKQQLAAVRQPIARSRKAPDRRSRSAAG